MSQPCSRAYGALLLVACVVGACNAARAPDKPLRVGGAVKPPVAIRKVEPNYPRGTRRAAAVIVVDAVITKTGDVRDLRVVKGVDDPFAPYLVAALKQWKFRPATKDGKPVDVMYTVTSHIDVR